MRRTLSTLSGGIILVLLPCLLASCGSGKQEVHPVKGKVVYKGTNKPLTLGQIEFQLVNKPSLKAYGDVEPDGTFFMTTYTAADGAAAGEHRVRIVLSTPGEEAHTRQSIHSKYGSFDSTDLLVTIKAGPDNQVTIEVERGK